MRLNLRFLNVTSFMLVLLLSQALHAGAKKVAIIGGGLAGLTAAYELNKTPNDFDVQVYEAKSRPGGRVFTVLLDGRPVEMGGENFNDAGDALVVHRLAKELGLKIETRKSPPAIAYYFDRATGKRFPRKELSRYFPNITFDEMVKTLGEAEKKSKNLGEVLDQFFDHYKTDDATVTAKRLLIREIIEAGEKNYEGGDMKQLSPRYATTSLRYMMVGFLPKQKPSSGSERVGIVGGNSRLVLELAKRIEGRLHLRHPLLKIAKAKKGGYDLEFAGGEKATADLVILALPAKPYKGIQFGPGTLDASIIDAISSLGYGTHAKILVPTKNPKVSHRYLSPDLLVWANPGETWTTFYFAGDAGIMKDEAEFQRGFDLGAAISSANAKIGASGIHYKKPAKITVPTEVFGRYSGALAMSWTTDPYTQASYSYYPEGRQAELETTVEVKGEKVVTLFVPVNGSIFFAGEHTTVDQDIRGTMEAAADSGARAAVLIKKFAL